MLFAYTENKGSGNNSAIGRQVAWSVTALLWITILVVYRSQVALVVEAWGNLPSHAHGYVVLLVVAYLVWTKRAALAVEPQAPSKAGIMALVLSGAAAFAGEMVSAGVVVQFSVVFMLLSTVWAVMGDRCFRVLFGPLCFLFFAIPFGYDILPTLMDWTANATVIALRASGVPVLQQDRNFVIPSGSWSVVEACAGIRYLLTSFFVGSIFAYITYTKWRKRVIFILFMLLLSLLANWLRAYLIVMAAHLSNNQWGFGLSHLAFGWFIFAFVVMVSFAIGVRWRDPEKHIEKTSAGTAAPARITGGVALLTMALVLGWSQGANYLLSLPPRPVPTLDLSNSLNGLEKVRPTLAVITPYFLGASAIHDATYRFGDNEIGLTVAYYRNQRQGAKLVSVNNVIEPTHTWIWHKSGRMASTGDGIPELRVEYFSKAKAHAVVATVYWIGGRTTSSAMMSKFYQALNLLTGKGDDGAMVVISTTNLGNSEASKALIETFVRDRLPGLLRNLDVIQAGSKQL